MCSQGCKIECGDCPRFAMFLSTVDFVDYDAPVKFSQSLSTQSKDIYLDETSNNIVIKRQGVYYITTRVNTRSRSSWAMFDVAFPNNFLIQNSFMTNSLSEDLLLQSPYSSDNQAWLVASFVVNVETTGTKTVRLVNITGDIDGKSGYDFTGVKVEGVGKSVKVYSKDNVVSGIPFPGILVAVHQIK